MRTLLFSLLLIVSLVSVGCSDPTLTKTATALHDVSLAVAAVQQTAIDGNKQGLISEADTRTILLLCQRVNTGGQQASAITRGLVNLPPAQRGNLLAILNPLVGAVNDALGNGVIHISDPGVRDKIHISLVAIQTGLTTAQLVLQGSN